MKTVKKLLTGLLFFFAAAIARAQADTARITQQVLLFTDSLAKADQFQDWSAYANLAPAPVIKYYGGIEGYLQHIQAGRARTFSAIEELLPASQVLQLRSRNEQWQCVIRQSRYFHRDDKQYHFITYLIAQSMDDGQTWRLFDVSYNSVANIIYMFPEIFDDLAIKEPQILTAEQEAAQEQAATQEQATAKKTVGKKK